MGFSLNDGVGGEMPGYRARIDTHPGIANEHPPQGKQGHQLDGDNPAQVTPEERIGRDHGLAAFFEYQRVLIKSRAILPTIKKTVLLQGLVFCRM